MDPRLFFILNHFDEDLLLQMRLSCKTVRDIIDKKIIPLIEMRADFLNQYTDLLGWLYYKNKFISLRSLLKSPRIVKSQKYLLYLYILLRPKDMRDFDTASRYHLEEIAESLNMLSMSDNINHIICSANKYCGNNVLYIIADLPQLYTNRLIELIRDRRENNAAILDDEDEIRGSVEEVHVLESAPLSLPEQMADYFNKMKSYNENIAATSLLQKYKFVMNTLVKLNPKDYNIGRAIYNMVLGYFDEYEIIILIDRLIENKCGIIAEEISAIVSHIFNCKLIYYKNLKHKLIEYCRKFAIRIKIPFSRFLFCVSRNTFLTNPHFVDNDIKLFENNAAILCDETLIDAAIVYNSNLLFQEYNKKMPDNLYISYFAVEGYCKIFRHRSKKDCTIADKFIAGLSQSMKMNILHYYNQNKMLVPIDNDFFGTYYDNIDREYRSAYVEWFFNIYLFRGPRL